MALSVVTLPFSGKLYTKDVAFGGRREDFRSSSGTRRKDGAQPSHSG